jgi:hypothetical protein
MLKISQYPQNADGTPMDLEVGVLTDSTGNGGARLAQVPIGPDGAPIDAKALIMVDANGVPILPNATASNRVELAAVPPGARMAMLLEENRAGVFMHYTSAAYLAAFGRVLATDIATDTQQGILVATATGAWMRRTFFNDSLNVRWFGAQGTYTGAAGPDDTAAIVGTVAVAVAFSTAGNAIYRGGASIYFPKGWYYNTLPIEPLSTVKIHGAGGLGIGAPTRITCAAGATGIRAQAHNTSGAGTVDGVQHFAGDNLVIEDIYFIGSYNGANTAEVHGLHAKRPVHVNRCTFTNFQGDGLYAHASFTSGGVDEGNDNNCQFTDCQFIGNRNGTSISGSDTNTMRFSGCQANGNRVRGFDDGGFLGNSYFGCSGFGNPSGDFRTTNVNAKHKLVACYTDVGGTASDFAAATLIDQCQFQSGYTGGVTTGATVNGEYAINNDVLLPNVKYLKWSSGGVFAWLRGSAGEALYYNVEAGHKHSFLLSGGTFLTDIDVNGVNIRTGTLRLAGVTQIDAAGNFPTLAAIAKSGSASDLIAGAVPAARMPALTGDVTSTVGTVGLTIAANIVTYAKFQQVAASSLVGNPTGSLANAQGITLAGGLAFSGTTLTAAGALTPTSVASTGGITSSGGGIGYATGAGGTAAQATSKATTVVLNKLTGQITLNAAALGANTVVSFTLTNSQIAANDELALWVAGGEATAGSYLVTQSGAGSGSRTVNIRNLTAGSLSEAVAVGFSVNKAVIA